MTTTTDTQLIRHLSEEYGHILALEQALGLKMSNEDQRPRIDYFHDALRALTNHELPQDWRTQRLCLEWLAYDAGAIRYLEQQPLSDLNPRHANYSPHLDVLVKSVQEMVESREATREDIRALKHHYLRYGVMFVALFKPFADRDYLERVEEMDVQVTHINTVISELEKLGQGGGSKAAVTQAAQHTGRAEVVQLIAELFKRKGYKVPEYLEKALVILRYLLDQADRNIRTLESAHLNYASAQLGLVEIGKPIVKELRSQGIQLAGEHTEQALGQQDTGRGMDR